MNMSLPATVHEGNAAHDRSSAALRRFIAWLAGIGLLMAVTGVALNIYLRVGPQWQFLVTLRDQTYVNSEMNMFAWYSGTILAAIGFAFLAVGLIARAEDRAMWPFVVLALVALFMSADEITMIHEHLYKVASLLGWSVSWTYSWVLVAVPLAAIVGVVLLAVARRIDRQLRTRLIVAGAIFLLGAVGFEVVGTVLQRAELGLSPTAMFLLNEAVVFIEETLELGGAILALWAVLAHFRMSRSPLGITLSTVRDDR